MVLWSPAVIWVLKYRGIVPAVQKSIIKPVQNGKFVITATQMLECSQQPIAHLRKLRTLLTNAIFDGSDAVMLSLNPVGKYRFMPFA